MSCNPICMLGNSPLQYQSLVNQLHPLNCNSIFLWTFFDISLPHNLSIAIDSLQNHGFIKATPRCHTELPLETQSVIVFKWILVFDIAKCLWSFWFLEVFNQFYQWFSQYYMIALNFLIHSVNHAIEHHTLAYSSVKNNRLCQIRLNLVVGNSCFSMLV